MKKKPFFSRPSKEVAISYLNRQAFVLASACTLPIAVLIYLIKKPMGPMEVAVLTVAYLGAKALLMGIIFLIKIKNGEDQAFIEKEERLRLEKLNQDKEKKYSQQTTQRKGSYAIQTITPIPDPAGAFKIEFEREISFDALPVISINDVTAGVVPMDDYHVKCLVPLRTFDSTKTHLKITAGAESKTILNPYYFSGTELDAVWQNEGTSAEKKIILPAHQFPYATQMAVFRFSLLINSELKGTYDGRLNNDNSAIVIPLKTVFKHECTNKKCALRFGFGKPFEFTLPKPVLLTVNGQPTRSGS